MTDDEILDMWAPGADGHSKRPVLGKNRIIRFARDLLRQAEIERHTGSAWNRFLAEMTRRASLDSEISDEHCDAAILRAGLWSLASIEPANLAMLRRLCRETVRGLK